MLNNVLNMVRSTVNNASGTLSATVQSIAEKNRNKKKLKNLKSVMMSGIVQINRTYITLGKEYYRLLKNGEITPAGERHKELLTVIDANKEKIISAREQYCAIKGIGTGTPPENAAHTDRETAESTAEAAEEKTESTAEAVEKKTESADEAVEETAENVVEADEEKAKSTANKRRSTAAAGIAGVAAATAIGAAATEKNAESTSGTAAKSVKNTPEATGKNTKRSGKDLEKLKQDNRRLREALMGIMKKIKVTDERNDKGTGSGRSGAHYGKPKK